MSIRQLLYFSYENRSMSEQARIELLNEARQLNAEHNITGLLLYVEGFFFQCIEGSSEEIEQLVENIRKDERNRNFIVLTDREISEREFPQWSMGFRAFGVSDLQKEEGFQNIKSINDLHSINVKERSIMKLMQNLYIANAG